MRLRMLIAASTGLAAAAVAALAGSGTANASVNQYTILANSPKPAVCHNSGTIPPGTWMQNKPCGYFIGTAMSGATFDVHSTTSNNYHYGRVHGTDNLCAWIPPGALSSAPIGTAPESCSTATSDAMSHRRSFGRDFNGPPHVVTDGSPVSVDPSCSLYYNYYTSSAYDTGALRDRAGSGSSEVQYRFTTNGAHPAVVVRDAALGWGFMDRGCVTDWRDVAFDDQDD